MPQQEIIVEARKRVRDSYGAAFESKATDDFVLKMAQATVSFGESNLPPQPAIIEFEPEPELAETVSESAPKLLERPAWRRLAEAITAEEEQGEFRGGLPLVSVLRQLRIERARSSFLRSSVTVRERLEHVVRGGDARREEGRSNEISGRPFTETCWLNQTLRTAAVSSALAEVAGEDKIKAFDAPRLLKGEVRSTAGVVGAPSFRKTHGMTGKGIIVAVIDSEVAGAHPAFGGRVQAKKNYTDEPWGTPGSHGTAVAGIIASGDAVFSGIAPEATVYNYKVLATFWWLNADDFGGALALQQALEDGVHVANCSWGAGPAGNGTSREARACNDAWNLGMAIVKSAGNRGSGAGTLTTPADAEGVIVVGACNRAGNRLESYSSRGPTADGRQRPHLLAPGGDDGGPGIGSCQVVGGFSDSGFGTSFAAPHVAGLLALLLEQRPQATPDQLRAELLTRCRSLGKLDGNEQGSGLVVI